MRAEAVMASLSGVTFFTNKPLLVTGLHSGIIEVTAPGGPARELGRSLTEVQPDADTPDGR
jgi:hypothetical protein